MNPTPFKFKSVKESTENLLNFNQGYRHFTFRESDNDLLDFVGTPIKFHFQQNDKIYDGLGMKPHKNELNLRQGGFYDLTAKEISVMNALQENGEPNKLDVFKREYEGEGTIQEIRQTDNYDEDAKEYIKKLVKGDKTIPYDKKNEYISEVIDEIKIEKEKHKTLSKKLNTTKIPYIRKAFDDINATKDDKYDKYDKLEKLNDINEAETLKEIEKEKLLKSNSSLLLSTKKNIQETKQDEKQVFEKEQNELMSNYDINKIKDYTQSELKEMVLNIITTFEKTINSSEKITDSQHKNIFKTALKGLGISLNNRNFKNIKNILTATEQIPFEPKTPIKKTPIKKNK